MSKGSPSTDSLTRRTVVATAAAASTLAIAAPADAQSLPCARVAEAEGAVRWFKP